MRSHSKIVLAVITALGLLASGPIIAANSFQEVVAIHAATLKGNERAQSRNDRALSRIPTSAQDVVNHKRIMLRINENARKRMDRATSSVDTSVQDAVSGSAG